MRHRPRSYNSLCVGQPSLHRNHTRKTRGEKLPLGIEGTGKHAKLPKLLRRGSVLGSYRINCREIPQSVLYCAKQRSLMAEWLR